MASGLQREYSDCKIIEGNLKENPGIFRHVQHAAYPTILKIINEKKLKNVHANEVFQDAMIVIFKKIKKGPLNLSCKFTTYFIGVCKTILRFNRNNGNRVDLEIVDVIDDEQEIEDLYKESREFQLYRRHFNKLKPKQRKILLASLSTKPYKELFTEFGYKSADVLKTEITRVKKLLIDRITSDPDFKKCNGGNGWSI